MDLAFQGSGGFVERSFFRSWSLKGDFHVMVSLCALINCRNQTIHLFPVHEERVVFLDFFGLPGAPES